MGQWGWQERDDFGGQCLWQRHGRGRRTQSPNTEPAHTHTHTHADKDWKWKDKNNLHIYIFIHIKSNITFQHVRNDVLQHLEADTRLEFMQIYEDNPGWPDWNMKWNVGKWCRVTTEERFWFIKVPADEQPEKCAENRMNGDKGHGGLWLLY